MIQTAGTSRRGDSSASRPGSRRSSRSAGTCWRSSRSSQEIGGSLHFVDIVQSVAPRLGEAFGLDRCSIFLAERGGQTVRLVASYEDPSIRNYVVDLDRYPELKRALQTGADGLHPRRRQRPDAAARPRRADAPAGEVHHRGARSRGGARRSARSSCAPSATGPSFSEADVQFCQVVASLTAKALRNAHRFERLQAPARRGRRPAPARTGSGWRCSASSAGCWRRSPQQGGPVGARACSARATRGGARPAGRRGHDGAGPGGRRPVSPAAPPSGPPSCAGCIDRANHAYYVARRARDLGRRVRPPLPRAAGARGGAPGAPHPRQPHPARRRRARDRAREAHPPPADALARQRLHRPRSWRRGRSATPGSTPRCAPAATPPRSRSTAPP